MESEPERQNLAQVGVSDANTRDQRRDAGRSWRWLAVVVGIVSGFLLLSWGGAVLAAPVTLPLMAIAVRLHPAVATRVIIALIAGLTAAEVAWALTYLAIEEAQPWIWLVPLVSFGAVTPAFVAIGARSRRLRIDQG